MTAELIAVQHLLPSVQWLRRTIATELPVELKILVGKPYSTIEGAFSGPPPDKARILSSVEDIPWQEHAGDLLILDEGGLLHRRAPLHQHRTIVGIEQTSSGMQSEWLYPAVLVCRSAAKLAFESQIIARGICRKLENGGLVRGAVVGVIGLGALGSALARHLLRRGVRVWGADAAPAPNDLKAIDLPVSEVVERCSVILGCTGADIFAGENLPRFKGVKTFISCSSATLEFQSLLKRAGCPPGFGEVRCNEAGAEFRVLNGGYPINFDRTREWELHEEVLLTRKLSVEGLKQALTLSGEPAKGVMLSPQVQFDTIVSWMDQVPEPDTLLIPDDLSPAYCLAHSEGEHVITKAPSYALHSTTPVALERMRSHLAPYDTLVRGRQIAVLPGVWSPAYDWSSDFYIANMGEVADADFLEIGSGTGVISVFAALAGARRVVAVDINPQAAENTRLNFERHRIEAGETHVSDVFSEVRGKYDVIMWNAPYHGADAADMLERACTDGGYAAVRRFFEEVGGHLKPGGRVLFGFAESGDIALVNALIRRAGLYARRRLSDWRNGYDAVMFELVARSGRAP